jgi:hypothetical protein
MFREHPGYREFVVRADLQAGAFSHGWSAVFELDWDTALKITLDTDFRHQTVRIVFKLALRPHENSASLEYFSTGEPTGGEEADTRRVIEALADARLSSSL